MHITQSLTLVFVSLKLFASCVHKTLSISLTYFTLPVVEILSNDDCLSGDALDSCPKIQSHYPLPVTCLMPKTDVRETCIY